MQEFSVDRKNFYFFLKFIFSISALFISASYLSDFYFTNVYSNNDFKGEIAQKLENIKYKRLAAVSSPINTDETMQFAFVGDVMLDRGVKNIVLKKANGDWTYPFQNIAGELNKYDFVSGNLEGPISDRGEDLGALYSFRMTPDVVAGLNFAGFKALSVANNHVTDWGKNAVEDTVNLLESSGILAVGAGASAFEPKIINVKGVKVALLAFSDVGRNGDIARLPANFQEIFQKSIGKAKTNADLAVVSFHFGEEYQSDPTERQIELAHAAIDDGADLVVGSHPHVIQSIEKYKNRFIAYSLGNFIFDQSFSEDTMRGLLLEVTVKNKKITDVRGIKIKINPSFQPEFEI